MSFKAILSVPVVSHEKKRDHVDITCTFVDEAQYQKMAKENFASIHDLIYNIVWARKGKEWQLDLQVCVETLQDPDVDLISIGSF
nr:hypothetical protein Cplu_242 [Cedratvirus plubellavi]